MHHLVHLHTACMRIIIIYSILTFKRPAPCSLCRRFIFFYFICFCPRPVDARHAARVGREQITWSVAGVLSRSSLGPRLAIEQVLLASAYTAAAGEQAPCKSLYLKNAGTRVHAADASTCPVCIPASDRVRNSVSRRTSATDVHLHQNLQPASHVTRRSLNNGGGGGVGARRAP